MQKTVMPSAWPLMQGMLDETDPLKVTGRVEIVFINMGLGIRICFNQSAH